MKWLPTTGWVDITPEIAREILSVCNYGNRRMNQFAVDGYARDMSANKWAVNGDAIKFSKTHRLLDGQQRLAAIVKSGKTVRTYVVTGVDEDVFWSYDGHRRRSCGTVMELAEVKNGNSVAAIAKLLFGYMRGFRGVDWTRPTVDELRGAVDIFGEPLIQEAIHAARGVPLKQITSLSSLYVLGTKADERLAAATTKEFFQELGGTLPSMIGHPSYTLRIKFQNVTTDKRYFTGQEQLANCVKAWNAHYNRQDMRVIRWRTKANPGEPFPSMIGFPYSAKGDATKDEEFDSRGYHVVR